MSLRARYLSLLALRWFATCLIIPVATLLPLERGLSLAELGLAFAAQGVVVLLLEVPSVALTDAWGRRPVLLASSGVPVMAHLGLTPQSVHSFGGYKVQGRGEDGVRLLQDAKAVPLDERAEEVDSISGRELPLDLYADARLVASVDNKSAD